MATTSPIPDRSYVSKSSKYDLVGKLKNLNILEHTRRKREKHHAKCAMIAAIHNASQSRFYQLPPKLILTVTGYLPASSLLSLRGACLKLHEIVMQPKAIQADEYREIRHMVRRDAYRKYCNSTNESRVGLRNKACSFYHRWDNDHPRICCDKGRKSSTAIWKLNSDYNVRICTIMRSDPITLERLQGAFDRLKGELCKANGCSTTCIMYRWRNHLIGRDEIAMKVTRGFGRGEPTDPEWLAQTDPSSAVVLADMSLMRKVLGPLGMLAVRPGSGE
ncbi:uncharacterized protein BDZ99DRAFT_473559 [Mytilinidion resinicola]|uniref:F-box domain-containing protein n=1 Tax=Mytilinidion resinicola TaxID=574789 RepID=A0A6A6YV20_9PEZI|nr:uncharacterized protein BDZ99DRAFT_473559 [Mytilinidion resinicola]KAF2812782.1 hypothetical protein BDZ99DRAFT_473559 [Mytilinidion resinicola]